MSVVSKLMEARRMLAAEASIKKHQLDGFDMALAIMDEEAQKEPVAWLRMTTFPSTGERCPTEVSYGPGQPAGDEWEAVYLGS